MSLVTSYWLQFSSLLALCSMLFSFAHSEICSFPDEIFSYLKFHRASIAFHVASFCLLPSDFCLLHHISSSSPSTLRPQLFALHSHFLKRIRSYFFYRLNVFINNFRYLIIIGDFNKLSFYSFRFQHHCFKGFL